MNTIETPESGEAGPGTAALQVVSLRPSEDRRLRAGHLWIYSNEINTSKSPLASFKAGQLVRVQDSSGRALGVGTINPQALLTVRLLTARGDAQIDTHWFERRIRRALSLREAIYDTDCYRLLYGEGDGVPGLVVDRYGDVLVVQLATAGMDAQRDAIVEALQRVLSPSGIWLANDLPMRESEGLSTEPMAIGDVPDPVEVREGGLRYQVSVRSGQKTGWFFDQRDNRARLARYVKGARLLDVYSYAGGWALSGLAAGAASAMCVDSSAAALESAANNAKLNGLTLDTRRGDGLDTMRAMHKEGAKFEVVVVDPPALIKRKRDYTAGFEHYVALNRAAIELLVPGGILVSSSCSFHLDAAALQLAVLRGARAAHRSLQTLEQGGQGPDHPVHPAIVETRYLKTLICRAG